MKKWLALVLTVFFAFSFAACNDEPATPGEEGGNTQTYEIYMPDGAPALAMAKLIKDDEQFGETVHYTVVAAANIGASVLQKKADVAIMPVTAASKTIGSGEEYVLLGVVTHGNIYVMSSGSVSSLADLKGQVIGVIGQGQVPDVTFRALLDKNAIGYEVVDANQTPAADKVGIRYFADASALLPLMKTGQLANGLLPEPAATKITTMNPDVSMKIDIQEVYGGDYPQAVLVAKKSITESDPAFLKALMTAIEENAEWISANDENAASAVDAINSALAEGVTPSLSKDAINKTVVENCNIYLQLAADAKTSVNEYLAAMKAVDGDSASAVSDAFFCTLS